MSENIVQKLHAIAAEARQTIAEIDEASTLLPGNAAGLAISRAFQEAIARECELAIESGDIATMVRTAARLSE